MTRVVAIALLIAGVAGRGAGEAAPLQPALPDSARIYCQVVNRFWETNCYILAGKSGQAIVIDPGDELEMVGADWFRPTREDANRIYGILTRNKLKLKYIVLTHGHIDHIGAVGFLKEKTGAKLLMHTADMRDGCPKDAHMVVGGVPKVDRCLQEGEVLSLDGMSVRILHVPGHSPGSIALLTSYKGKPIVFSGDTLLWHSVGRTNFLDGSGDETLLYRMIREKLFTLPDETVVLPGHYALTTIGEEKANNPFLNDLPIPEIAAPLL